MSISVLVKEHIGICPFALLQQLPTGATTIAFLSLGGFPLCSLVIVYVHLSDCQDKRALQAGGNTLQVYPKSMLP